MNTVERSSPATRLPTPEPFELWAVDLDAPAPPEELESLSPAEQARAGRFVFARDRRRFLAAHAALRRLLATRTGIAARCLRLETGTFGKPFLVAANACSFNLSHSHGLALIALAPGGEIGVDVEWLRPVPDASALAERHCTRTERAVLEHAGAAGRDHVFLRGWTRKEACLKAIGSGLSIEALAVDAGLDAARRVILVPTAGGPIAVEVESLPGDGRWVGALARVVDS